MFDPIIPSSPPSEFDLWLTHHVEHVLQVLHIPSVRRLEVRARDGIVTLRGVLRSYYQRQMARTAVLRVPGVCRLDEEIEIVASPPENREDFRLPSAA